MKTAFITGANKGLGFETARQLARKGFLVLLGVRSGNAVNNVSPGWVRTDMSGPQAPRSPEEGVRGIVVWLATEAPHSLTGKFLQDGNGIPWEQPSFGNIFDDWIRTKDLFSEN